MAGRNDLHLSANLLWNCLRPLRPESLTSSDAASHLMLAHCSGLKDRTFQSKMQDASGDSRHLKKEGYGKEEWLKWQGELESSTEEHSREHLYGYMVGHEPDSCLHTLNMACSSPYPLRNLGCRAWQKQTCSCLIRTSLHGALWYNLSRLSGGELAPCHARGRLSQLRWGTRYKSSWSNNPRHIRHALVSSGLGISHLALQQGRPCTFQLAALD